MRRESRALVLMVQRVGPLLAPESFGNSARNGRDSHGGGYPQQPRFQRQIETASLGASGASFGLHSDAVGTGYRARRRDRQRIVSERTPKRYTPEQQLMKVAIVVLIFPILVTSLSYLSVPLSLLAQKVFPKTVADAISVSGSLIVGVGGALYFCARIWPKPPNVDSDPTS